VKPSSVPGREVYGSGHVGLGLVHQGSGLGQLGPELVGDTVPLHLGLLGIVLRDGSGDEGQGDPPSASAACAMGLRSDGTVKEGRFTR
jgi:hypothetical protein